MAFGIPPSSSSPQRYAYTSTRRPNLPSGDVFVPQHNTQQDIPMAVAMPSSDIIPREQVTVLYNAELIDYNSSRIADHELPEAQVVSGPDHSEISNAIEVPQASPYIASNSENAHQAPRNPSLEGTFNVPRRPARVGRASEGQEWILNYSSHHNPPPSSFPYPSNASSASPFRPSRGLGEVSQTLSATDTFERGSTFPMAAPSLGGAVDAASQFFQTTRNIVAPLLGSENSEQRQQHLAPEQAALNTAIREGRLQDVETRLNDRSRNDRLALINHDLGSQDSLFNTAIRAKNMEAVRLLHRLGANVNQAYPSNANQTPLHFAAEKGDATTVRFLLANGALVNTPDRNGDTPLHEAARREDDEGTAIATVLLEAGANLKQTNQEQHTPLHIAAICQRDTRMFQAILDRVADPAERVALINQRNRHNQTALDIALCHGGLFPAERAEMACFLLDKGASSTQVLANEKRPLQQVNNQAALRSNRPDDRQHLVRIACKLLEKGADLADLADGPFKNDVIRASRPQMAH